MGGVSAQVIWCGQSEYLDEIGSSLGSSTRASLLSDGGWVESFASNSASRDLPQTLDLFPALNPQAQAVEGYTSNPESDGYTFNLHPDDLGGSSRPTSGPLMSEQSNRLGTLENSKKRKNELSNMSRETEHAYPRVNPETFRLSSILSQPDFPRTINLSVSSHPWRDISSWPDRTSVNKRKGVYQHENSVEKDQNPLVGAHQLDVPASYEEDAQPAFLVPQKLDSSSQAAEASPREQSNAHQIIQPNPSEVAHTALAQGWAKAEDHKTKKSIKIVHSKEANTHLGDKDAVFQYYAHQTWLEAPKKLSKQAGFISLLLASDLLRNISKFIYIRKELEKMQASHYVLLPFTYKLILKGLIGKRWNRILRVWESFWGHNHQSGIKGPINILRAYAWISDYIYEINHPDLYRGGSIMRLSPASPSSIAHMKLMRDLSISDSSFYHFRKSEFKEVLLEVYRVFKEDISIQNIERLEEGIAEKFHQYVLARIQYFGNVIVSNEASKKTFEFIHKTGGNIPEESIKKALWIWMNKNHGLGSKQNMMYPYFRFIKHEEFSEIFFDDFKLEKSHIKLHNMESNNIEQRVHNAFCQLFYQTKQSKNQVFKYIPEKIHDCLHANGLI